MTNVRGPTWWMLVLLGLVLWAGGDVRRGLWAPDEARYAYVAREMREGHTWFIPHLHGEPYPDKPPLMFWLINAGSVFTGGRINGFAARLPSLLGAILALWATARLMERWRDGAAAWRAVAVLMTAYLFWWEAGWGQIDMLLCGLEMMSLWCFFTATDPGHARRFVGAYVFAGFATFAKGPVGLAVPFGVYAFALWAAGEARTLKRGHWLWGIPIACAIPGVWLLVAWLQGAPHDYFAAMFGAKSFGRVIQDHHAQKFYYYLPHFLGEFLPWTLFLPAAYRGLEPGPLRRRLVAWAAFVLVLFSCFVGKRNLYILPMWPALAMIVAAGWDGFAGLTPRWPRVTGWIVLGFTTVLGLVETGVFLVAKLGLVGHFVHRDADVVTGFLAAHPGMPWTLVPGAILLLVGNTVLIGWFQRDGLTRRWFAVFAALLFGHEILLSTFVLPSFNALKAPLELSAEARTRLLPGQPIYLYYPAQLAIVPLYADRPGRYLRSPDEIEHLLADGAYGIIVFNAEDWTPLAERFANRVRARPFTIGSGKLVWVDFPPPATAAP